MAITATTLSAALPASGTNSTVLIVASTTGFNNPIFNQGAIPGSGGLPPYNVVQVDAELMKVLAVNTVTLQVQVERGFLGTAQVAHTTGAAVSVGLPNDFQSLGPSNFQAGKATFPLQITEGPANQLATNLSGTADALTANPGFFLVKTGSADAITIPTPTLAQEGNIIEVWSDTAFAHTVTAPSALFKHGATAVNTIATFAALAGAGLRLRVTNQAYTVLAQSGITFS